MKIALLGYGRMGKEVEKVALSRGHEVLLKIRSSNKSDIKNAKALGVEAAIDFSLPEVAPELISSCLQQGIKVISGTTGWLDSMTVIRETCELNDGGFLYASNFSIGVNLFFELNRQLAKLMYPHADYKASIEETHHVHKKDAPSGTAISLAEIIIEEHSRYNDWKLDDAEENQLEIKAFREQEVPGTHQINYQSEIDKISIRHEALSRSGFALGAVIATEWIQGKSGIFNMSDVLEIKHETTD